MEGGHQSVLEYSLLVTLLEQAPNVPRCLSLRKEATIELRGQHFWVIFENGSPQANRVRHQVDFFLSYRVVNVVDSILKVRLFLVDFCGLRLGGDGIQLKEIAGLFWMARGRWWGGWG